jgi:hypothetical protein
MNRRGFLRLLGLAPIGAPAASAAPAASPATSPPAPAPLPVVEVVRNGPFVQVRAKLPQGDHVWTAWMGR